jgi:hypothetical protein
MKIAVSVDCEYVIIFDPNNLKTCILRKSSIYGMIQDRQCLEIRGKLSVIRQYQNHLYLRTATTVNAYTAE